jgi:mannitol-1-phosphate/altronate dehydrogenase
VQGRIKNGTLFPNISAMIMENMQKLTRTIFHTLHDKMEKVFDLIKNDLDLALASGQQYGSDGENRDSPEEDRLRKELAGEVNQLKRRHEELLGNIASY